MQTVSSNYLKMIYNGCCDVGENDAALNDRLRAMLPDGGRNLDNPTHRYERRLAGKLINAAVEATGDTAAGVKVGMKLRPETFLDMGYALTLCDDLRGVIKLNQAYQPLIQQLGTTHFEILGDSAWLKWIPLYGQTKFYAQFVEMIFAGYASVGRWLLWGDDNPVLSIHFRHSAPDNTETQKAVFCDNLIYESDFDGVEFIGKAVDVPMPNRNPELLSFLKHRLDAQLKQLYSPVTAAEEALQCIQAVLAEGRPNIGRVAKVMGMSERTLRRRLESEGQSFRSLLERARKENCEAYMRSSTISQTDMALRLGFNDQSAFSRAFKVWFGQTPTEYRQALVQSRVDAEL